jgi:hypothetical protein
VIRGQFCFGGRAERLPLVADGGYSGGVDSWKERLPRDFEMMDEEMARVIRAKTGAERLKIASDMFSSARRMLVSHLRAEHPDWNEDRVQREAS